MTKSQGRTQFIVRELKTETDMSLCARLDHNNVTDYVWQMDVRRETEELAVRFRTVRLPRSMPIAYPRDEDTLIRSWVKPDCFLVATTGEAILGYVNMRVDASQTKGWIHDLVVDSRVRRRKIGSALLEQTIRWAYLHHIAQITLEMQTKNYPGIRFALKHGFEFCGFNDRYYTNQDITLFFGKNL